MKDEKVNIVYSDSMGYAFGDGYAYDFTKAQFQLRNITEVTRTIFLDRGFLYIGLKASPIKGEEFLVGDMLLPYVYTGLTKVTRDRQNVVYRIKKREDYDFGFNADLRNSVKGAKVYFVNRLNGKDYLDIINKMH